LRILYGGAASVVVALVLAGVFALLGRRSTNDAEKLVRPEEEATDGPG
jgi:hypothetical protein